MNQRINGASLSSIAEKARPDGHRCGLLLVGALRDLVHGAGPEEGAFPAEVMTERKQTLQAQEPHFELRFKCYQFGQLYSKRSYLLLIVAGDVDRSAIADDGEAQPWLR